MATEKFIATQVLEINGVRAHNPGDEVPAANVERHGWQDGVAREGTKAAESVAGDVSLDGVPEPELPVGATTVDDAAAKTTRARR